ncbi:hypothetical protein Pfo_001011 [Paulownia fortunei]|nr:hypothetical protein Pfo_001011 [Paulownia fortunei]
MHYTDMILEEADWNGDQTPENENSDATGLCKNGELVKGERSNLEEAAAAGKAQIRFLQMLQNAESRQFSASSPASSFQLLLKLQHQTKPWLGNHIRPPSCFRESDYGALTGEIQAVEPENCVTHEIFGANSTESKEKLSSECNHKCLREGNSGDQSTIRWREKRKRKRGSATGNKEEAENQRMTHIAVERNRRRLMNEHLTTLRSLMPPFFVQRGDQASIIGGAIDLVKELEQLLQSLEAHKRLKTGALGGGGCNDVLAYSLQSQSLSPSQTNYYRMRWDDEGGRVGDFQVTMIEKHANLKIECCRRPGQLVHAILTFENLKLAVLHLNVTSLSPSSVHYSFSLKIEDGCKVGASAADIAGAVHHIFTFINANTSSSGR